MIRRIGAVAVLVGGMLAGLAGTAFAGDSEEYVSGHTLRGEVVLRSTSPGSDCITRRALFVTNFVIDESVDRYDGQNGSGWVCVTQRGYDANPLGSWWNGRTSGPVG